MTEIACESAPKNLFIDANLTTPNDLPVAEEVSVNFVPDCGRWGNLPLSATGASDETRETTIYG